MFEYTVSEAASHANWRAEFDRQYEPDEPRCSPAQAVPSGWLALEVDAATGTRRGRAAAHHGLSR